MIIKEKVIVCKQNFMTKMLLYIIEEKMHIMNVKNALILFFDSINHADEEQQNGDIYLCQLELTLRLND